FFLCPDCTTLFSSLGQLGVHRRKVHGQPQSLKCKLCVEHLASEEALVGHAKTHWKKGVFKRDGCGLLLQSHGDLLVRKIKRSFESVCRQTRLVLIAERVTFLQTSGIADAELPTATVGHPKPVKGHLYTCDKCSHVTDRRQNMVIHQRTHTGQEPLQCPLCPMTFSHKHILMRHIRGHTVDRPFRCRACPATFEKSDYLVIHMRTHSGGRPYECHVCFMSFSQKTDLVAHVRGHSRDAPYWCTFCSQPFTTGSLLTRHVMTSHPV
ncbi:zinc finger protein, putative, partial [Ixodes scapularis]